MKKILFMLLTIPLLLAVCGSDDDENSISIKQREYTMNYKDEAQIEASSPSSITYASKGEYVAKVSASGLITGGRVGWAEITLTNEHSTSSILVNIKPIHNLFPEPIDKVSFNDSRQKVISIFGAPDFEDEIRMIFDDYHKNYDYIFLFDTNNNVEAMAVMIPTLSIPTNLIDFINERYQIVSFIEEDDALFINEKQNMAVAMFPSPDHLNMFIAYIENSSSSRSASSADTINEPLEIYLELSK